MNISTRDFSFIAEDHISQIFNLLAKHKIKVSMMQNSAISLALCLEDKFGKIDEVNQTLTQQFSTDVVKNVSLYTVRNAIGLHSYNSLSFPFGDCDVEG
jgi:aspartate kinase